MSLGYVRGNTWVVDEHFEAWRESDTYQTMVQVAARQGFHWTIEYSYSARRYTCDINTIRQTGPSQYQIILQANAFDAHPMLALVKAIVRYGEVEPYPEALLMSVLLIELECHVLRQKLLPMRRLESELEKLADAITIGMLK